MIACKDCGLRFRPDHCRIVRCPGCIQARKNPDRTKVCRDCGNEFQAKHMKRATCEDCRNPRRKLQPCMRCGAYRGSYRKGYCSRTCKIMAAHEKKMSRKRDYQAKHRWVIFNRDGCKCVYCGRSAPDIVLSVEHIVPHSEGGEDTAGNLVTSCLDCNCARHAQKLSPETEKMVRKYVETRNIEFGFDKDERIKHL